MAHRKRLVDNERGGALLTAMAAAVFLSLLGLVLLGTLRHSLAQTAGSEAKVQAEALALKGVDEALAMIRAAVRQANGGAAGGIAYGEKVRRIQTALGLDMDPSAAVSRAAGSLHHFLDGHAAAAERGRYRLEIVSDTDNYEAFLAYKDVMPDYPYSRVIRIRATGEAGEWQSRTVTLERTIVVSTINPVFSYPLSGKENLHLNGAVTVVGDVLARNGSIVTSDKAEFVGLPGSAYAKQSDYPAVQGFYREKIPAAKTFSAAKPFEDSTMPLDGELSVASAIQAFMARLDAGLPLPGTGMHMSGLHAYSLPAVTTALRMEDQWVEVNGPSELAGDLAIRNGVLTVGPSAEWTVTGGSVLVDFPSPLMAAADLAGTVVLDPGEALIVRGDAVLADGFKFRGILAVSGDLLMTGSVSIDGTVYAGGNVEMKQTKAINREAGWADKPLIVLAGGKIFFSDSRPDGAPAEVRAFLYSEEEMALYGVQTKLHIRGGVHGKTVTLNAVREGDPAGKTDTTHEGTPLPGEAVFAFTPTAIQKTLGMDRANLQIRHDNKLYLDPPAGIPVTDDVTVFVKNQ